MLYVDNVALAPNNIKLAPTSSDPPEFAANGWDQHRCGNSLRRIFFRSRVHLYRCYDRKERRSLAVCQASFRLWVRLSTPSVLILPIVRFLRPLGG